MPGLDGSRDGRPRKTRRVRRDTADRSFASTPAIRRRMQDQRARDTAPELALRRQLHAFGLRYRVDRAPLPGLRRRADILFGPARVAVYLDGCFWHGCPEHGNRPRANSPYWGPKIERNRARDVDTDTRLAAAGWAVVRAWEHEDPADVATRVAVLVTARRPAASGAFARAERAIGARVLGPGTGSADG
jgi:DNA mismatch endonuclease (patch repair protein)